MRYQDLIEQIEKHNYQYYVLDKPIISDREYDALFRELQEFEAKHPELKVKNSPTDRVGGAVLEKFSKHQHRAAMLQEVFGVIGAAAQKADTQRRLGDNHA